MKTFFRFSMWMAIMIVALIACDKNSDNGGNNPNPPPPPSGMQDVVLKGRVSDTNGNPLGGVSITTGSLSAVSANNGEFSFSQAGVVDSRAVFKFKKDGYFTLTRSGVKADEMCIEAVMTPKGNSDISLQTSFNTSSAQTLAVSAGMKVKLSAASIVRADGSMYNGTVNADMLYLDPNNENFAGMMPGGDLAAIRANNENVMLVSWGMTNVNFTDNAGNPLQLNKNFPAEVTFPIPEGMENAPPPTIPLWSFDEVKGIWIEEGVATLQGNVYVGTVTHFSWVNLDEPAKRATIKGKVKDCKDEPVSFVRVKIGQTAVVTNSKGEYSTFVPEYTPVEVSVEANGGSDSKNVPGLRGGDTYIVPDLKVPCGKEGETGTLVYTEKAAIKYMVGYESDEDSGVFAYYVITFDNNGKRFRMDYFLGNEEEKHYYGAQITNHINKTYWEYTFYYDENNPNDYGWRWVDCDYKKAPKDGDVPFQFSASEASLLSGGFTKLSNKTYAGKLCSVYTKTTSITAQGQTQTIKYTFAVWNGLILLWEYEYGMGGESASIFYVAQAVTLDVPEVAFTKTIDISWLP